MKISILSDLHICFYQKDKTIIKEKSHLKSKLDKYLDSSPDVEVLVVAGDLSHYNQHFETLEQIADMYNYKKIFAVLGNHDAYLVSENQKKKYKNSSLKRMEDWYLRSKNSDVVSILNGEIEEYNSIKFGGTASFYDCSYHNYNNGYDFQIPLERWKRTMNDYRYIKGMGDCYDIFQKENTKIKDIIDSDIVITHVNPICSSISFQEEFKNSPSNMFYCFDGGEYVKETSAKIWCYGHSHGFHQYNAYGVDLVMNALGYPEEYAKVYRVTIEINPETKEHKILKS